MIILHDIQNMFETGVSGNSHSRPFLRMKASDSLSRIMGMDFFIPFPFPIFGNAFFSFPSRSRIMGMVFFHSIPIPEFWECFFFHSLPVPELREWVFSIPFSFLNFRNGIIHSRSRSRTPKCHSRSPLVWELMWIVVKVNQAFMSSNTCLRNDVHLIRFK